MPYSKKNPKRYLKNKDLKNTYRLNAIHYKGVYREMTLERYEFENNISK